MTEDSFKLIKYDTATVYFKKLTKHLNIRDTINAVKMKLLNNCFNEWHKIIEDVIKETEDLL